MYNDLLTFSSIVNEPDLLYIKQALRTSHIGLFRALDVATTHNARVVAGLGCKDCIYRETCAKRPALRHLLIGTGVTDMSSLRSEEKFISDL